jgi:hypothetical protein
MSILIQSRQGRDWIRSFAPSERRQIYSDGSEIGEGFYPKRTGCFSFGGISPPNEKILLCVLSVSAVKMYSG